MLRCVLVDDETPARQRLRRLLGALHVDVVGEAADGLSALELLSKTDTDVVFLDIDLPELDGFGVAAALPQGPAIVFVTAYDEHALRAFEAAAVDYLVKPVKPERLAAALTRVRERSSPPPVAGLLQKLGSGLLRRMAVRCGTKFTVFDPTQLRATVFPRSRRGWDSSSLSPSFRDARFPAWSEAS